MRATGATTEGTAGHTKGAPGGHRHHGHLPGHAQEDHHEGAPEWLISFADNVALLMGFFVLLLAMNMAKRTTGGIGGQEDLGGQKTPDMLDFAIAVRDAFNNPVSIKSTDPSEQLLVQRLISQSHSQAEDVGVWGPEHRVQTVRPGSYYALSASVPFTDDSSELTAEGRAKAAEIAGKLRGIMLIVEVRGHVSAAEAFNRPQRAMPLAFDRAMAVANVLAANGVSWWQIRLIASGDNDRVNPHPEDVQDDRANARVEVIVTDRVVPDEVPTAYSNPAQSPQR